MGLAFLCIDRTKQQVGLLVEFMPFGRLCTLGGKLLYGLDSYKRRPLVVVALGQQRRMEEEWSISYLKLGEMPIMAARVQTHDGYSTNIL